MKLSGLKFLGVKRLMSIILIVVLWCCLFFVFQKHWIQNEGKEIIKFRCQGVEVSKEIERNQYFTRIEYWMNLPGSLVRRRFWPNQVYLIEDKFLQYNLASCLWKTDIITEAILYNKKDLNLDELYAVQNPVKFTMKIEDEIKRGKWPISFIAELKQQYQDPSYIEKWYEVRTGSIEERLKSIKWRQCNEFYKPCFLSLRNGKLDVKVWQMGDRKIYQIPYLSEADFTWKFLMDIEGEEEKYIEFTAQVKDDETRKDLLLMFESMAKPY